MVRIIENKHYYPSLTGVPSTLIICKLSWNNNKQKKKEKKKKRKNRLLLE